MRTSITSILTLLSFFLIVGHNESFLHAEIKDPRFRTLKCEKEGEFLSPPVIRLGSSDRIMITFDEIREDYSDLQYRLVHCNSDWKPSGLVDSEYLDGFNIADVSDYAYSVNTFVHYVNYMITIPNEEMRPLVSGNYLLEVFQRDDPEKILLNVPFRVVEDLMNIRANVTPRTDRGTNDRWQQLSIALSTDSYAIGNPYQDLKVEVIQNSEDGSRHVLKTPLRVSGNEIIYEHSPELIFKAGNEYRRFESISNLFAGMHVDSLRHMGSNYHVWLKEDHPKADRSYEYDNTQHGRFMVREYNATDSNLGADYITVHFTLNSPRLTDADIYVSGEMTEGKYDRSNRMEYDQEEGVYVLAMPLKQGAYNYRYVTLPRGHNGLPDASTIDGDKYETVNEYTVYAYHRPPGARYDRLVGYTQLYSR